jgi:hypothetical protein
MKISAILKVGSGDNLTYLTKDMDAGTAEVNPDLLIGSFVPDHHTQRVTLVARPVGRPVFDERSHVLYSVMQPEPGWGGEDYVRFLRDEGWEVRHALPALMESLVRLRLNDLDHTPGSDYTYYIVMAIGDHVLYVTSHSLVEFLADVHVIGRAPEGFETEEDGFLVLMDDEPARAFDRQARIAVAMHDADEGWEAIIPHLLELGWSDDLSVLPDWVPAAVCVPNPLT